MIDNIKFATTTVGNFGTKVSNFSNKENANMTKANISKAKGDLWKKEEFFEGLQPNTGRGYSTWRPFLRNDFFFTLFGYIRCQRDQQCHQLVCCQADKRI